MKLRDFKSARERREFVEKETDTLLGDLGSFEFSEKGVSSRNCENLIGAVHVPVGIAGPLKIANNQRQATKDYYVPLATTEGALVASVNRGCRAIAESNGAMVKVKLVGVTRSSAFSCTEKEINTISQWIKNNNGNLQSQIEKQSKHTKLLSHEVYFKDNYGFINWYFDTDDAMGMNMVTIATELLSKIISKEFSIRLVSIASNVDSDKKPSKLAKEIGRGRSVSASVVLSEKIVQSILKTTSEDLFNTWRTKCVLGSSISGSLGENAHHANIIAALFIATGQDPAHVVEGSLGETKMEQLNNDQIEISVHIPALLVGTVGGGTTLTTQKQAFSIMNISGSDKTNEFARVIGGTVLAGEISLLSSLSEGSLARAHKKFAR